MNNKCYIGLGSNLGDRPDNLEQAARRLRRFSPVLASPVYETAALVPPGAPASWNIPYLNAVVECEWSGSASELLQVLKGIEKDMGRKPAEKWAPRLIDLDILLCGLETTDADNLKIPHPGMWDRAFVLDPLKDLAPGLKIPGQSETVLSRARKLAGHAPLWMGILNLTPDSFSDGGSLADIETFGKTADEFTAVGADILDLGAESTRPGAAEVTAEEEWVRLKPALAHLRARDGEKIFRPRISIDTRRAVVAEKALAAGADWINDVSGLSDPAMISLLKESGCDYVLMHSLSVPADKNITLPPDCDPVAEVKLWAEKKIRMLADAGVNPEKIIFDPGIGFGKTAEQSRALLSRIEEFQSLPVRLMVGHSRKSFLGGSVKDRDAESIRISLDLARRGVDILRIHEPAQHIRAFRAGEP